MKTEEIIVPVRAEGLDEAIEKAKKLAALEKEIQELQKGLRFQLLSGRILFVIMSVNLVLQIMILILRLWKAG